MTEPADSNSIAVATDLPPLVKADWSEPPVDCARWYWTIGPAYAAVFVWIAYFDQLGRDVVPFVPFPLLVVTALVTAILCDLLLYRPAALWGYRSGVRLSIVASSTFGDRGAAWLTGTVLGLAAVVWYALALTYSLDLVFRSLVDFQLLDSARLNPWRLGPLTVKSPVVLLTLCWWIFITSMAGKSFAHVIETMMKVYTPSAFVLLVLTAIAGLICVMLGLSASLDRPSLALQAEESISLAPTLHLVHLIFGFFAMAGLMAAEWGRSVPDERDVRLGGVIGVGLTAFCTSTLALVVTSCGFSIAANVNAQSSSHTPVSQSDTLPLTFVTSVESIFKAPIAGFILVLFGIASLAPACLSVSLYTHRMFRNYPAISRKRWAWSGVVVAFALVATAAVEQTDRIFTMMGAVFAPAAGCLAADYQRQGGLWSGIRRGYHLPGVLAWLTGLLVGLAPLWGRWLPIGNFEQFQPASLLAFGSAFLIYRLLAMAGLESELFSRPSKQEA